MRMVARAAGGRTVGAGHVMRCLALAEGVRARGGEVVMSADLSGLDWVRPWVAGLDVELVPLVPGPAGLAELTRERRGHLVVLDDYGFAPAHTAVSATGALLLNIEDGTYGRRSADLVVDPAVGAEARPRADDGTATLLRGIAYAPLRSEVRAARRALEGAPAEVRRVGVVMGGSDARGLARAVATLVESAGFEVLAAEPGLALYRRLVDIDAVISAAGTSALELCCVGVPAGFVEIADNQAENARLLASAGAATRLGTVEDVLDHPAEFTSTVRGWLEDPHALRHTASTAQALVDGLGVDRILDATQSALLARRGTG